MVLKVEKWRTKELARGLKESTINRKLSRLRSLLSKAVEWKILEQHPLAGMKKLKEDDNPIVRFLSEEEEFRLRTHLRKRDSQKKQQRKTHNQWRNERGKQLLPIFDNLTFVDHVEPMILLSMHLGLRKSVLLNLKWTHINFEKRFVTAIGYETKNAKTRYIPLNEEAFYIVQAWRTQASETPYVFMNTKTNKPFTTIKKAWQRVLGQANIEKKAQTGFQDALTELLKEQAHKMLTVALEQEVADFMAQYEPKTLPNGYQRVVRNGHAKARTIQTSIGPIKVQLPRVNDRGELDETKIVFQSNLIPKYMRRTATLDVFLPLGYLKGISTNEFQEVLSPLVGTQAKSLSPSVISRLKAHWYDEYQAFQNGIYRIKSTRTGG